MNTSFHELAHTTIYKEAVLIVREATRSPIDRLKSRESFYKKYGGETKIKKNIGTSELAFLKWEIERGVLDTPEIGMTGSHWWRAINTYLIFCSTLATLFFEKKKFSCGIQEIDFWIIFLQHKSSKNWYRAHNYTIVNAYKKYEYLAAQEPLEEQYFINAVLYRLLFAGALAESKYMGSIGRVLASPRMPYISIVVQISKLYPRIAPNNWSKVKKKFNTVLVEEWIVLPKIKQLYFFSSSHLHFFYLKKWQQNNTPCYAIAYNSWAENDDLFFQIHNNSVL